jgi:hypothetical protein
MSCDGPRAKSTFPLLSLWQSRLKLRNADHRLCSNEEDRKFLESRLHLDRGKITRLVPGAGPGFSGVAPRRIYNRRCTKMLFPGSWIDRKGIRQVGDSLRRNSGRKSFGLCAKTRPELKERFEEMIAFVQSFGVQGAGGGSRILRTLLQGEHPPALSINTGLVAADSAPAITEIHIPQRPYFGRLERTRLQNKLGVFEKIFRSRFERRLRRALREHEVTLIHAVPHQYEILPISRVASEENIPYFLSIHDDLEFLLQGYPFKKQIVNALSHAWRDARGVFVISDEIGKEYARRYGAREYKIVTDGLTHVPEGPLHRPANSLRIYFMGLFHYTYNANLLALLDALRIVRNQHPDWDISVTCRCGSISCPVSEGDVPVEVLPFTSDTSELERDMLSADILYQPLPFEASTSNFSRFSMSTKMVAYLGSGLPILYHGPEDAAACRLLMRHEAAAVCTTLDSEEIARQLLNAGRRRELIAGNALVLARSQFMHAEQRKRFWQPICETLA